MAAKNTKRSKKTGKSVAVLCPGPSLSETWTTGITGSQYVCVLAVNRAALHDRVDVWCFNDPRVFIQTPVKYRATVLTPRTSERTIDKKGRHEDLYRHKVVNVDGIEYPMRIQTGFTNYTFPTALAYCKVLGATQIDVYGNDRTSEPDFDGDMPAGCNRNPARWLVEDGIVKQTAAWLASCGITITRVTPKGRHGIA
jgi:hypothetical protein